MGAWDFLDQLHDPCPVAKGERVEITGTMQDPNPLPIGMRGTVTGGNGGQIYVDWDNGSRLMLLAEDPYRVLPKEN